MNNTKRTTDQMTFGSHRAAVDWAAAKTAAGWRTCIYQITLPGLFGIQAWKVMAVIAH
jgi:hypothetical protein